MSDKDAVKKLVESLVISLSGITKKDMGQRLGAQIHQLSSIISVTALAAKDEEDAKALKAASEVLFWLSAKVVKYEFSHLHAAIIAAMINAHNTIELANRMDRADSGAKWEADHKKMEALFKQG